MQIAPHFSVSSSVLRKNCKTDFLCVYLYLNKYICMYIYIYIYIYMCVCVCVCVGVCVSVCVCVCVFQIHFNGLMDYFLAHKFPSHINIFRILSVSVVYLLSWNS